MHSQTYLAGPVALIAGSASALADQLVAGLAEAGLSIIHVGPTQRALTEVIATIVLVEDTDGSVALNEVLDWAHQPVLVLAATPELGRRVVPLLSNWNSLGLASEAIEVIAWRISQLVAFSQMPVIAAYRDALTGLLNRRAFENQLRQVAESRISGEVVGLLMIDLDRFKTINDSFGHVAGDKVLLTVGQLLPRILAPGDQVARLGGDEFGCLMKRYERESIRSDSERVLKEIAALDVGHILGHISCPSLSASGGLAFAKPQPNLEQLITEANLAAYEAKNGGRNRLVVYGGSAAATESSSGDLRLRHFESSARLATERLVEMITLRSRLLVETAWQEANTCPVTGLHSRRYLQDELAYEIDRARQQGGPLSLAFIDLDHFHEVNMANGWPTGDRVLQTFARVARANMRGRYSVARYGGEEFVIVMPDTTLDSARDVAERVRQNFESAVTEGVAGQRVRATLSAGVAQWRDDMESQDAFVNHASCALLRAKRAGRNRVELADLEAI